MRGIIEGQSIKTREKIRRATASRSFEVGADARSIEAREIAAKAGDGVPVREPRPSGNASALVLQLPQNRRTRRHLLDKPRKSLRGRWRTTSRRFYTFSSRRLDLDPRLVPALLAIPIALLISSFLWGPIGLFDLYAYRTGFALPLASAGSIAFEDDAPRGGSGQPLSVDPRDFQKIHRTEYVVVPGDTISEIAFSFDLDPGTILSANPIGDVRRLLPGTTLSIPDRDGLFHVVQPGESLSSISASYDVPLAPILDANDLSTDVLSVGETLFIPGAEMDSDEYLLAIGELFSWPVARFRFTSGYGMRSDPITGQWRMHSGIDLANAIGTAILAGRSGRVAHVQENSGTYGNLVIIDHRDGFRSLYAHLLSYNVRVGDYVTTGQVIGRMGNSGRSTGSHLHFSVFRNNRPEDPLKHLPPP